MEREGEGSEGREGEGPVSPTPIFWPRTAPTSLPRNRQTVVRAYHIVVGVL